MKKQQVKTLRLNKKSISSFTQNTIVGGTFISCPGVGICGTTGQSVTTCPPPDTFTCPPPPETISCDPVGICPRPPRRD